MFSHPRRASRSRAWVSTLALPARLELRRWRGRVGSFTMALGRLLALLWGWRMRHAIGLCLPLDCWAFLTLVRAWRTCTSSTGSRAWNLPEASGGGQQKGFSTVRPGRVVGGIAEVLLGCCGHPWLELEERRPHSSPFQYPGLSPGCPAVPECGPRPANGLWNLPQSGR